MQQPKIITGIVGVGGPLRQILLAEKDVARFWSKVDRSNPLDCWEWKAGISANGYAMFKAARRCYTASRVAWFIANGRQPLGHVCHSCDNTKCVNPAHLWLGDARANMLDKISKGRHRSGSGRGSSSAFCANGHPWSSDTLRMSRGTRVCRVCQRETCARYRQRRDARAIASQEAA